jgi:pyruvate/2-oxoglutarate dehydrogenase complex dihydrolipoamide acyltransferase (E2) component
MSSGKFVEVLMPQMGMSIFEGVVIKWHVGVGDVVVLDQLVCEVTTDKTDAEILAPANGVISEIVVAEGEPVDVGSPVALMEESGSAVTPVAVAVDVSPAESILATNLRLAEPRTIPVDTPLTLESVQVAPVSRLTFTETKVAGRRRATRPINEMMSGANIDPAAAADAVLDRGPRSGRTASSPLARRRAFERNIDLGSIRGTGRRGRICVHDVIAASKGQSAATPLRTARATSGADFQSMPLGYEDVPFEILTTSPHRRAISEHMARSRQTSAHMTTEVDVDMFKVTNVRSKVNASRERDELGRVSFLPFISKAAVVALSEFPDINATFQHDRLIHWHEVNLGIAVDTLAGLVVPVIRSAENMSVDRIASEIFEVAERARSRKLVPDDLRAGTFTVSNPGSVGAVSAPAIINQPQVAILGIPVIVKRPWVITTVDGADSIAARPILRLALTFDHRAVDGAYATRYIVRVKEYLEQWDVDEYQ